MRASHALSFPLVLLGLAACSSDGGGRVDPDGPPVTPDTAPPVDAPTDVPMAPQTITLTGTALERTAQGSAPVAGATIAAYRNSDESTPIATTTTDAQGNFSLAVDTGGLAVDGYLKATKTSYKDTYLYPPAPIAADTTAPINMLTPTIFNLLGVFAGHTQEGGNGFVALVVVNGATAQSTPVASAVVASSPDATAVRYSDPATGLPGASFTATHTDGLAYLFNLPGNGVVSVRATKAGSAFSSHNVKAWADALTTTLITP